MVYFYSGVDTQRRDVRMVVVRRVESGYKAVWQSMDVSLPEGTLGIEGPDGLGHCVTIEHGDAEPRLVGRIDYLPVKCLVDDQILRIGNRKTGCTDMFAASPGDNEVPTTAENLLDEFAALINSFLKRFALPDTFQFGNYIYGLTFQSCATHLYGREREQPWHTKHPAKRTAKGSA